MQLQKAINILNVATESEVKVCANCGGNECYFENNTYNYCPVCNKDKANVNER